MFPEIRCPVAILPRNLPDMCSVCMAGIEERPQPCQWRPNYARACSRRCDEQIRTGRRRTCPMWDMFKIVESDVEPELFPLHVISRPTDPVTVVIYDPLGGTIYPRPMSFEEFHCDYLHIDIIPDRQYGDRNEDHRRSMNDFQDALTVGNHQYLATRRTGTPPNGYFSGFNINIPVPSGHGNAMRMKFNSTRPASSSTQIEFEWDSDSSHHFTGQKASYLPNTFASKRMRVKVAKGKVHYTEGYGKIDNPMLVNVPVPVRTHGFSHLPRTTRSLTPKTNRLDYCIINLFTFVVRSSSLIV